MVSRWKQVIPSHKEYFSRPIMIRDQEPQDMARTAPASLPISLRRLMGVSGWLRRFMQVQPTAARPATTARSSGASRKMWDIWGSSDVASASASAP
jgi:hypothetical protein